MMEAVQNTSAFDKFKSLSNHLKTLLSERKEHLLREQPDPEWLVRNNKELVYTLVKLRQNHRLLHGVVLD